MKDASILAAEAEVRLARARLAHTATVLRNRLEPRNLAQEVAHRAYDRTETAAQTGIAVARARPRVAAGIGIGAVLLLLRRPLSGVLSRLFRRKRHATGRSAGSLTNTNFIEES